MQITETRGNTRHLDHLDPLPRFIMSHSCPLIWLVVRLGGGLGCHWGHDGGRLGSVRPSWAEGHGEREAFSNNRLSDGIPESA